MPAAESGAPKRKLGPDGKALSEESLHYEAQQLKASLATIDMRIEQARNELRGLRANSDEQDIWETNLVMLQVCCPSDTIYYSKCPNTMARCICSESHAADVTPQGAP